jgi:hypothetical protein
MPELAAHDGDLCCASLKVAFAKESAMGRGLAGEQILPYNRSGELLPQ